MADRPSTSPSASWSARRWSGDRGLTDWRVTIALFVAFAVFAIVLKNWNTIAPALGIKTPTPTIPTGPIGRGPVVSTPTTMVFRPPTTSNFGAG